MELNPSLEAASYAATEELPNILLNPKVYYSVHQSPLLVPLLSQINPVHTTPFYLFKIHFDNILQTISNQLPKFFLLLFLLVST
jgi:hypothetical protein